MVAKMTERLEVKPGDRILEIGTGSGYQAAILAWLGAEVTSLERQAALIPLARQRLDALAPDLAGSVVVREADGSLGDPAGAPWDGIIVTAAAPSVPPGVARPARRWRPPRHPGRVTRSPDPHGRHAARRRMARPTTRLLRLRPAHRSWRVRRLTGPDLGLVRVWFSRYWLAVWFAIISAIRASVLVTGEWGFDARLYLDATRAWLAGADPWVHIETQRFAAPPPTLVPLAPLAILPEQLGVVLMVVLAAIGAVATIRLLKLSMVVAAVPAVRRRRLERQSSDSGRAIDPGRGRPDRGVPQDLHALVPMVLTLRWRAVAVTAVLLLVTAPILPWASYVAQFGDLSAALETQSDGGLSATALPWLVPIAIIALVFCGRKRRGLAGGPGPLAGDTVVLLVARPPRP